MDGIKGGDLEETNGLINMLIGGNGGEGDLGQGLGDAHDGLELTDRDGDRGALIGFLLLTTHLGTDRDKVVAQLFRCVWGEAGSAFSEGVRKGKG